MQVFYIAGSFVPKFRKTYGPGGGGTMRRPLRRTLVRQSIMQRSCLHQMAAVRTAVDSLANPGFQAYILTYLSRLVNQAKHLPNVDSSVQSPMHQGAHRQMKIGVYAIRHLLKKKVFCSKFRNKRP